LASKPYKEGASALVVFDTSKTPTIFTVCHIYVREQTSPKAIEKKSPSTKYLRISFGSLKRVSLASYILALHTVKKLSLASKSYSEGASALVVFRLKLRFKALEKQPYYHMACSDKSHSFYSPCASRASPQILSKKNPQVRST